MTDGSLINVMALSDDALATMWHEREIRIHEASTLRQTATLISVGVAFFARPRNYTAPTVGFHPEAQEERWMHFARDIAGLVTGGILDVHAPSWVGGMVRPLIFEELESQMREWHLRLAREREVEFRTALEAFRKAAR